MKEILLAVPVLLPIAGGAGMLAMHLGTGGKNDDRRLMLLTAGVVAVNSLVIFWLLRFGTGAGLVLFRLFGNLTVRFELDPMGRVFAGLIAFLWPFATLYSFEYMKHEERKPTFFAYYVMTYGVTSGIALAGNLVTMYLCYEMLTLVTFPLVLFPMTKEAKRASRRYLYYSIGGAAFAFIGLVFVLSFSRTGNTDFIPGGVLNLEAGRAQRNLLLLVYVLAFFGFGVKAALFPLYGWLPKATVAPTPVIFAGKLGTGDRDGRDVGNHCFWLYHGSPGNSLETALGLLYGQQSFLYSVWSRNDESFGTGSCPQPSGSTCLHENLLLFLCRGSDASDGKDSGV